MNRGGVRSACLGRVTSVHGYAVPCQVSFTPLSAITPFLISLRLFILFFILAELDSTA
jgi:hypothetical protein